LIRTVAALAILILLGAAIAAYSYGQLQGHTNFFDQSSIPIDGHNYEVRVAVVDLTSRYAATVTGTVSVTGCCVDFYILNATSWNTWVNNSTAYSNLPIVHLNSSALGPQATTGSFSFSVSSSEGLILTFVNDRFPASSDAVAGVALSLQYSNIYASYGITIGATMVVVCVVVAAFRLRRRPLVESDAAAPSPPQPPMRTRDGAGTAEGQSV